MSNLIQIKRSAITAVPTSLSNGELAYTSNGDVLYIGAPDGSNTVTAIGGKRNPGTLTANQALVANSTSYLDVIKTANLYIGSFTVDTINAVANATHLGLSANNELTTTWAVKTYVDSSISNVSISSGSSNTQVLFNNSGVIGGDAGLTYNAGTDTLTSVNFSGNGASVTSVNAAAVGGNTASDLNTYADNKAANAYANAIAYAASNTYVNTTFAPLASPTFTGTVNMADLAISGNVDINGTLTTIDATNLAVNDSIIELARGNAADTLDIGFYGTYNDGTEKYTGLIRDQSDNGVYKLFTGLEEEPTTTVDTSNATFGLATLNSYLNSSALLSNSTVTNITANSTVSVTLTANTLTLTTALAGTSGGTGLASYTAEDIIVANSTNGFRTLSLGTDGQVLQSNGSALVYQNLDGGSF
jgi:hypothetical protein